MYLAPIAQDTQGLLSHIECLAYYHYFSPGKSVRPAPTELPQVWQEARVGSCSGAIYGLPFLFVY